MIKYRRAVPPRLRSQLGKREFVKSLGTANLDDAKLDYHHIAAQAEEELADAEDAVECEEHEAYVLANRGYDDLNAWLVEYAPRDPAKACAAHVANCREAEREYRSAATARVNADLEAFWRGQIIDLPLTRNEFYALPQFVAMRAKGSG